MSVLNQSGDEPVECPLCMEQLEVDDLNFFPCTCGYQICRFCWHRIRTDENGLCPACRKAYPENPADFRPLTPGEVQRLKTEKRLREQQRKQKVTESRQHLASVRVVQRNLVFVVGLPMRLADSEVLKKHDYFGKFGKIHKVVINQSTSYAGSQGPSASAYVTYHRAEDALRAIAAVNNIAVDGRTLKASLGTTKYCSHFMKNQICPKTECMYLHELGDSEASFTKEDMQQGKHQEYEKKLHEQLLNNTACHIKETNNNNTNNNSMKEAWPSLGSGRDEGDDVGPPILSAKSSRPSHKSESAASSAQLNGGVGTSYKKRHTSGEETRGRRRGREKGQHQHIVNNNSGPGRGHQTQQTNPGRRGRISVSTVLLTATESTTGVITRGTTVEDVEGKCEDSPPQSSSPSSSTSSLSGSTPLAPPPSRSLSTSSSSCSSASSVSGDVVPTSSGNQDALTDMQRRAAVVFVAAASAREDSDNQSFFSSPYPFRTRLNVDNSLEWDDPALSSVPMSRQGNNPPAPTMSVPATGLATTPELQAQPLTEVMLPDWQAPFNFGTNHKPLPAMQNNRLGISSHVDDELGFDPFVETQKGLAELMQTEQQQNQRLRTYQQQLQNHEDSSTIRHLPHLPPSASVMHSLPAIPFSQHFPMHIEQSLRPPSDSLNSPVQCSTSRLMEGFLAHCTTATHPTTSIHPPPPPPGFSAPVSSTPVGPYVGLQHSASKIMPYMNMQQSPQSQMSGGTGGNGTGSGNLMRLPSLGPKEAGSFSLGDWHTILPNLGSGSSSFAHSNGSSSQHCHPRPSPKEWQNDWTAMDPAIVTATPLMPLAMGGESSMPSNHGSTLFPWVKSMDNHSGRLFQATKHNLASPWSTTPTAAATAPPPGFSHTLRTARGAAPLVERAAVEKHASSSEQKSLLTDQILSVGQQILVLR